MPTYEYRCNNPKCELLWETEQKIKDNPLTECPECKENTAQRLISGGTGFVLKGNGWFGSGGY